MKEEFVQDQRRLQNHGVLFLYLVLTIVALIFLVSVPFLNIFIPYTLSGGSSLAKFHPASWLCALLIGFFVFKSPKSTLERHYRITAIFLFLVCLFLALRGKGATMATIVDIHLAPAILLASLSRLPIKQARGVPSLFVYIVAINAVVVLVEFLSQTHIFPTESYQPFFRPNGIFGHPIASGLHFCCAMVLVLYGAVDRSFSRPLMLLFLIGTAFCGVRGPLAVAAVIYLISTFKPISQRRSGMDYLIDFGVALLTPLAVAIAYFVGALDRVIAFGVWDDSSSQSRVLIFSVFKYLSSDVFWWGFDNYDAIGRVVNFAANTNYVENSFVFMTMVAGFPFALIFAFIILFFHCPATLRSFSFFLLFALAIFGTICFSSKGSSSTAVALTGYWIWRTKLENASVLKFESASIDGRKIVQPEPVASLTLNGHRR